MNNEIPKENNEEFDAIDLQVISKLQNLRKEIKAPYTSFLQAMEMLKAPLISPIQTPTKSPFYIPMFFKISVPALVVMMIVGFSVKNTIETKNNSSFTPINEIAPIEDINSIAMVQTESTDIAVEAPTSMMMKSLTPTETTAPANNELINITNSEFATYSSSTDDKFASYDEAQIKSFVNFYGQNF